MNGTNKGHPRHLRFVFLIPGLTIFKNNLSLPTTTPGGGCDGSIMSITALRVSSAALLQSSCCILMACLGLFLVAESIASLHSPNMSALFLRDVFGKSYKRFSPKSVCAELNSEEPLKGIWTSFLFFFFDCGRTFFSSWFGCVELCSREDLERLK